MHYLDIVLQGLAFGASACLLNVSTQTCLVNSAHAQVEGQLVRGGSVVARASGYITARDRD